MQKSESFAKKIHKHGWNLNPKEAIQVQEELRSQVVFASLPLDHLRLIAGVDVGLPRATRLANSPVARAAIAVLDYNTMALLDQATAEIPVPFPYVPGLLSFREMPAILAALERLKMQPDVFLVDGHGYAHPRRFGLACHLGVWLDKPAIGCGKSILVGEQAPLENSRGSVASLQDGDETIGAAVRTRDGVKPVYVSVGHRTDLDSAIRIVLNCGRGVRLTEPVRLAHHLASS
ncbi:deoxyribonuclease V [Chloroflexota bacterium]